MLPISTFLFWFAHQDLWAILFYHSSISIFHMDHIAASRDDFDYVHLVVLLVCNPAIIWNYPVIFTVAFSLCLLFYAFLCYLVACLLAAGASRVAYDNLRRYNRGSLFRQSAHVLRRYCRDLWEGNVRPPHVLRHYISLCGLLIVFCEVCSQRFFVVSLLMLVYRLFIEDLHYGPLCRTASIFNVILFGFACSIPMSVVWPVVIYEAWNPTLGDDCSHPGYVGATTRLDNDMAMPADGLCFYHCLAAAADLPRYVAGTEKQRVMWARRLRDKTIALLTQHGLSSQARRLGLSGPDGYPDEPDFYWISKAINLGFELWQDGLPAPLPYGDLPITAVVYYRKVADGAGHLSDHYDLKQVYYDRDLVGRRLRLWRKTAPQFAMFGSGKTCRYGHLREEAGS